jgi:ferredoxin
MAMKATLQLGYQTMWKGEYLARVDDRDCVGCGACVERCPFGALALIDQGVAVLDESACFGCGICRSACSVDALSLLERPPVTRVTS